MIIENISKELFKSNEDNINDLLKYNFDKTMLDKLYFIPKNINKNIVNDKLTNKSYIEKVMKTINFFKGKNIENIVLEKIKYFENNINSKITNGKIYLIIGLDTTTIYSIKLNNEDVTVLLLESTAGNEEKLNMLLAHEFTHFIRKQKLNKNIFEDSIGERFVTEGIGCNYSREIVPNKEDYEYCIVDNKKVEWVKNNIEKIEKHMQNKKDTSELMSDYFSMSADENIIGMPTRTGYVYGYFKVREYLNKHNLRIQDIIDIDCKEILNN